MVVGFLVDVDEPDEIPHREMCPDGFLSFRPTVWMESDEKHQILEVRMVARDVDRQLVFTKLQVCDLVVALNDALREMENLAREMECLEGDGAASDQATH